MHLDAEELQLCEVVGMLGRGCPRETIQFVLRARGYRFVGGPERPYVNGPCLFEPRPCRQCSRKRRRQPVRGVCLCAFLAQTRKSCALSSDRAFRVRLPPWRQIDLGTDLGGGEYDLFSIALALIALPFTLVLIPLALAILERRGVGQI